MMALARLHFFWLGMTANIEGYVKVFARCLQAASAPVKVPLSPCSRANKLWARVHLDFGEPVKAKPFFVIMDSYSKFIDAQWLASPTSAAVIRYLRGLFRILGPPETIVSDRLLAPFESRVFHRSYRILDFSGCYASSCVEKMSMTTKRC